MAKKPVKEAGTALIFATAFFVLTTIAFGVLWYTEMSNSTAKDAAVEAAKKDKTAAEGVLADAKLDGSVYRLYWGIADEDDVKQVSSWGEKEKKRAGETIKKINQLVVEKVGKGDASKVPQEVGYWKVDDKGVPELPPPPDTPLNAVAALATARDVAKADLEKSAAVFEAAASSSKAREQEYITITKKFEELVKALPANFDSRLQGEFKKIEDRMKAFATEQAEFRAQNSTLTDKLSQQNFDKQRLERQIQNQQEQIDNLLARLQTNRNEDTFLNDQPHGKILRRLPDDIVEINIGSDALVRPGLTFTVLPQDFPEKGRQSRMQVVREPDERGVYRSVERFVEKANIEVIEVLGPNLSRARITKEYDRIRDGAGPGDLIYNAAWRKGAADHIALIGVFDANGDGSDDIESVIRDLNKMGIPVDAFYDLRTRKWVGQITQQTRFVVEGWYPVQGAFDPNRDEKTKMIGDITAAVEAARKLGITPVKFQDFFPRIGYRMKIDTTPDKINQAIAPYLNRVSTEETLPTPKGGN